MSSELNENAGAVQLDEAPRSWKRWLAAILLLALGLRLYGIGDRSFWYDEGVILYVSKYLSDPIQFLDPERCNDAPLHVIISALWYKTVLAIPGVVKGSRLCDGLIRLYPCMASLAGVWLVFVFSRRLTASTLTALIAAFFCAVSPFQIYYAQDLRAYALHVTLNLIAVYCMLRAVEENRARFWLGYVAAATAGIYNHFFMVWCLIAINICFAATMRGHWRLVFHWTAAQLAVILLSLPALRMALYVNLVFETSQEVWYERPGIRLAVITFKNFFAGYSANVLAYQAITVLAALAVGLGVFALRKQFRAVTILVILAATPIVIGILYWRTKDFPYYTHRLFVFSALPCYALAAAGVAWVRSTAARTAVLTIFGIVTVPVLADYYAQRIHPIQSHTLGILYKPDNRGAAHFIAENLNPKTDVVAHRIRYTKMPFDYYLDAPQFVAELTERQAVGSMAGYPSIRAYETGDIVPVRLDTLLDQYQRLWLVNTWWRPFDPEPGTAAMWQWLDAHAIRQLREPFDGLTVYRYRTQTPTELGARIAIVQDTGIDRTPLYYTPNKIVDDVALLDRSLYFSAAVADGLIFSFDYGRDPTPSRQPIGTDEAHGDTFYVSFPPKAAGAAEFECIVENRSANPRNLHLSTFASAEVLAAPDFRSLDPNSSVWQYGFQVPPAPGQPVPNRLAIVASLSLQSPPGKTITAPLRVDSGAYDVWARVRTAKSTLNHDGARARFALFDAATNETRPFASLVPTMDALPNGWHWISLGRAEVSTTTQALHIAVDNPDNLSRATFYLDRVRFLPAGVRPEVQSTTLKLGPGAERHLRLRVHMLPLSTTRCDVELFDPPTATFRNLQIYVARG